MDIVWLVVDSLSFRATSFADQNQEMTPNLRDIAELDGVVFTKAHAPGPLSPSSHAAMFTGTLPSVAGMHEAHPYFDGSVPTIAEKLQVSHETHMLSLNMWLSQGLERGFDHTKDFSRQYLLFRDATDPQNYFRKHDPGGSSVSRLWQFATSDGKPVRSLLNYLNYRRTNGSLVPEEWGDAENYQYADQINAELMSVLERGGPDKFVFANYMDVHPPFDASGEALERFAPGHSRSKLPIGVGPERHIANDEKSYEPELMDQLYKAAVWDFDRKLGPVLRKLVRDDAMVIVTSDHGIWDRDTAYSDNRLHVPLVIFTPDHPPRTVDKTVNLKSLPRTIMEYATDLDRGFEGESLLDVSTDQTSITEVIHHPNEVYDKTGRVDVTKAKETDDEVQRDLVLIKGNTRVEYIGGTWNTVTGDEEIASKLKDRGEEILASDIELTETDIEYDTVTRERLHDLGYM